jgi:CxxC motif-containing protein (DUF1111 family)
MKRITAICLVLVFVISACRKYTELEDSEYDPRMSGGVNTVFDKSTQAFSHPFPGLTGRDLEFHDLGDAGFEQIFVSAPAPVNSGLGPLFNNVSCASCHHNDGTGVPSAGQSQSALLFRVSVPGENPDGSAFALEGYGNQLQDKAVYGKSPECRMSINYTYQLVTFPDGDTDTLWVPDYIMSHTYHPINNSYEISPRLAPAVFGLGMLEAISESDMKQIEDVNDADGDGISGKINYVWDPVSQSKKPGRFGLKANAPSLKVQVAGAYHQDMGITSSVFHEESSFGQSQYDNLQDDIELPDSILDAVMFYVQTLSVPARRDVTDPVVLQGEQIFRNLKCNSCHKETMQTKVNVAMPSLSNQRIHPYTDMLLHDMGAGLADNRPDFDADGREWRTSPLWGIGLRDIVNYPAFYLHDGRARSLSEAILWHDGEAKASTDAYKQLSSDERKALIRFLKSL